MRLPFLGSSETFPQLRDQFGVCVQNLKDVRWQPALGQGDDVRGDTVVLGHARREFFAACPFSTLQTR
jgi:hypothetical protein